MPRKLKPSEQRLVEFWVRVIKLDGESGCWAWTGAYYPSGYTVAQDPITGRQTYAHRVAWTLLIGAIPTHLQVDHLCRNRGCVNPSHMELVTPRENTLRGRSPSAIHARKTHCPQGHAYDTRNTYLRKDKQERHCRACGASNARRYRAQRRAPEVQR